MTFTTPEDECRIWITFSFLPPLYMSTVHAKRGPVLHSRLSSLTLLQPPSPPSKGVVSAPAAL